MNSSPGHGIPDIELPLPGGGTVNPADFAGHELVVLFSPLDEAAAAQELADYNRYAQQFSYNDAWMIAVGGSGRTEPASRFTLAGEPDGGVWQAFGESFEPSEALSRDEGGVFLFGRGGCLTRAWPGPGHAREVAEELGQRM
ncbi:MAG: redoxin domain-containing protein [Sphingomonas sp.]|nr:redoxin domain-containing protein [Sphingomonas sp.]